MWRHGTVRPDAVPESGSLLDSDGRVTQVTDDVHCGRPLRDAGRGHVTLSGTGQVTAGAPDPAIVPRGDTPAASVSSFSRHRGWNSDCVAPTPNPFALTAW